MLTTNKLIEKYKNFTLTTVRQKRISHGGVVISHGGAHINGLHHVPHVNTHPLLAPVNGRVGGFAHLAHVAPVAHVAGNGHLGPLTHPNHIRNGHDGAWGENPYGRFSDMVGYRRRNRHRFSDSSCAASGHSCHTRSQCCDGMECHITRRTCQVFRWRYYGIIVPNRGTTYQNS